MNNLTTTLGVLMDATCFLTVFVYFPLANWWERKPKKRKTLRNNFWTISKQEIIDELKIHKHGY